MMMIWGDGPHSSSWLSLNSLVCMTIFQTIHSIRTKSLKIHAILCRSTNQNEATSFHANTKMSHAHCINLTKRRLSISYRLACSLCSLWNEFFRFTVLISEQGSNICLLLANDEMALVQVLFGKVADLVIKSLWPDLSIDFIKRIHHILATFKRWAKTCSVYRSFLLREAESSNKHYLDIQLIYILKEVSDIVCIRLIMK